MSPQLTERTPNAVLTAGLLAMAHMAAIIGIGLWAWHHAEFDRWQNSPDFFNPQYLRGELIYPVPLSWAPATPCRMEALDLKTGRRRDFNALKMKSYPSLVSDGERLWCLDTAKGRTSEIQETDGLTTIVHKPTRTMGETVSCPFLYEGALAIIERSTNSVYRLLVLNESEWEDRGRIALPGPNRRWKLDAASKRRVLVPRTTADPLQTVEDPIHVVNVGGRYHLYQSITFNGPHVNQSFSHQRLTPGIPGPVSYRRDFEFVLPPAESASALFPENIPVDATDWVVLENCEFTKPVPYGDDVLHASNLRLWIQENPNADPHSARLEFVKDWNYHKSGISPHQENGAYFLFQTHSDDIEVFQYDGTHLGRMWIPEDGFASWYKWLRISLLVAFLLSLLATVLIADRITNRSSEYSFGKQDVLLATIGQRAFARAIDMAIICSPLAPLFLFFVLELGNVEAMRIVLLRRFPSLTLEHFTQFVPFGVCSLTIWLLLIDRTANSLPTPGRKICGIRVVRSTYQRCSFARALLRELFLWFDTPLLLTPFPGIICQLITQNRQRIGDLIADTIVIQTPVTWDDDQAENQIEETRRQGVGEMVVPICGGESSSPQQQTQ